MQSQLQSLASELDKDRNKSKWLSMIVQSPACTREEVQAYVNTLLPATQAESKRADRARQREVQLSQREDEDKISQSVIPLTCPSILPSCEQAIDDLQSR